MWQMLTLGSKIPALGNVAKAVFTNEKLLEWLVAAAVFYFALLTPFAAIVGGIGLLLNLMGPQLPTEIERDASSTLGDALIAVGAAHAWFYGALPVASGMICILAVILFLYQIPKFI